MQFDSYPVSREDGEVRVCVVYYGRDKLAEDATIELKTAPAILMGMNSGMPGMANNSYTLTIIIISIDASYTVYSPQNSLCVI